MDYPILYSFVRCPYAMRARMALMTVNQAVIVREINLRDKAPAFLELSPKGTVPVLLYPDGRLIEESADIVCSLVPVSDGNTIWTQKGPELFETLHQDFIPALNAYKYPERYPDFDRDQAITVLQNWLSVLDGGLPAQSEEHVWACYEILVFPFVRQCFVVDQDVFRTWGLPAVESWLGSIIESSLFQLVMTKLSTWSPEDELFILESKDNHED